MSTIFTGMKGRFGIHSGQSADQGTLEPQISREDVRRNAIDDFAIRFPRGSTPGGSQLVLSLRTLRHASISGRTDFERAPDRIGVPGPVLKDVLARTHEAIQTYRTSNQQTEDSNTFHRSLDEALRLATTQAGIKKFMGKAVGAANQNLSPGAERQALDRLHLDAVFDYPFNSKAKVNLGEGYTTEAADEAMARMMPAIREYERSDKTVGDNNRLVSATDDATRFLDTDAGIRQFEGTFPRNGNAFSPEKTLGAVENILYSLRGGGATAPHTYDAPLPEGVARVVVNEVRTAVDAYNASNRDIRARNELRNALSKTNHLLGVETKRAQAIALNDLNIGPLVELRGQADVSTTRTTRGGYMLIEPNGLTSHDRMLGISPRIQARTVRILQVPGALRAHYMGQEVPLEPGPPAFGGNDLEWAGSTQLATGEYAYLRLKLNADKTGVEEAAINHTRHQGDVTRTESFKGQAKPA